MQEDLLFAYINYLNTNVGGIIGKFADETKNVSFVVRRLVVQRKCISWQDGRGRNNLK